MDWQPYGACCLRNAPALEDDARMCPDCGHVLLRCMAFAECHSLVSPGKPCPICVAPTLMINKGAVVSATAGERMAVPLILLNSSPAKRTLWLKRVGRRDGDGEAQITLPWQQLDGGAEGQIWLETQPMAGGGTFALNVFLVLATRYKGIEEEYAFSSAFSVKVSTPDAGPQQLQVNVSGAAEGTGTGHNVIANIHADRGVSDKAEALENRQLLTLEHADGYELAQSIRGYRKEGLRVPRNVTFTFSGFRAEDTPEQGSMAPQGRMRFGRNSRTADAASNPSPNDVCLRAWDAKAKTVDEPATMALSRHHFELVVANDRLCIHARATKGMQVNAEDLSPGQVFPIVPSDRIVPIPGRSDKLTLRVAFTSAHGEVERIEVSRTPATS